MIGSFYGLIYSSVETGFHSCLGLLITSERDQDDK